MADTIGFPELQADGSYQIPSGPVELVAATWGTVHYWAHRHELMAHRDLLKTRLKKEFPFAVCVEEGSCEYLIFPEKAVAAVPPAVRRAIQAEEERRRLSRN